MTMVNIHRINRMTIGIKVVKRNESFEMFASSFNPASDQIVGFNVRFVEINTFTNSNGSNLYGVALTF